MNSKTVLIIAAIAVVSYFLYKYCNPEVAYKFLPNDSLTFEGYEEEDFNFGDVKRGAANIVKKFEGLEARRECGNNLKCYFNKIVGKNMRNTINPDPDQVPDPDFNLKPLPLPFVQHKRIPLDAMFY